MPATYDPIATTTLGSAAATITFSSIPATYTDIRLVVTGAMDTGTGFWTFRLNNDSGSYYSLISINGSGSSVTSGREVNFTYGYLYFFGTIGTAQTMATLDIFSYAGSTNKTSLATYSGDLNGSGYVERSVNLWRQTSAINTLTIRTDTIRNFAAGTTATLYGIKAA
jgi:hypothetical protein